jgi:hypothetical protein
MGDVVGGADELLDGRIRQVERRAVGRGLGTLLLRHLSLLRRRIGLGCYEVSPQPALSPRRFSFPRALDSEQPDYLMSELRFCSSAAFTGRGEAGNCSTVACWPSHSRVSSTVSPSGNSSAS